MCGIAGWYRRGHRVGAHHIAAQCDRLRHRGPDDSGVVSDGDFGFGMRRLAVIDAAGGRQPMWSADRRHVLVFNGAIYNFRELRRDLERLGRRFDSSGDTAVLLAAWCEWGDDAWRRLDGMFAAAVWDTLSRTLTLARDPLGIKPLYVTEQRGGIAFASELKALRLLPGLRFDIDPRAVNEFFRYGHVRWPRSIYRQVRMLAPGHVLTVPARGAPAERAFWTPQFRPADRRPDDTWVEEFRSLWLATVADQMTADAPPGLFLSGGVDSAAVAAAMVRSGTAPGRAFTAAFPGTRFDESAPAARVAAHLGLAHEILPIDLQQASDTLPRLADVYDEPFADPAAVPLWHLSRAAAGQLQAVLAGDGGDEVFAGYRRHVTASRAAAVPRWLGSVLAALPWPGAQGQKVRRFGEDVRWENGYARFFAKTQIVAQREAGRLLDTPFHADLAGAGPPGLAAERFAGSTLADPLEQFLQAELAVQLPSAMLTKVDRASMAHGLEVRVPFLSVRLVDWALTLPLDMKLRDRTGKHVVRRAVAPWLPAGSLDRPKQGFQMPLAAWFAGDFSAYARSVWHDSGLGRSGMLNPAAVEDAFARHLAGRADHSRLLYAVAVFGLWLRKPAVPPAAIGLRDSGD